jgi:hypothetical protein
MELTAIERAREAEEKRFVAEREEFPRQWAGEQIRFARADMFDQRYQFLSGENPLISNPLANLQKAKVQARFKLQERRYGINAERGMFTDILRSYGVDAGQVGIAPTLEGQLETARDFENQGIRESTIMATLRATPDFPARLKRNL